MAGHESPLSRNWLALDFEPVTIRTAATEKLIVLGRIDDECRLRRSNIARIPCELSLMDERGDRGIYGCSAAKPSRVR